MKLEKYRKITFNKYINILLIFIFFVITIGIGYSALISNLSITGNILVKKQGSNLNYTYYINNVLSQNIPENNGTTYKLGSNTTCNNGVKVRWSNSNWELTTSTIEQDTDCTVYFESAQTFYDKILTTSEISKYDGLVTDSVGETVTANNVYNSTSLFSKYVIFGGFCWHAYRTTETKGVKLVYNGIPSEGSCTDTYIANNRNIGTSKFNSVNDALSHSGYMYNAEYNYESTNLRTAQNVLTKVSMEYSTLYYYGTGVTYSDGKYTLTGTSTHAWSELYPTNDFGKYTCKLTTNDSCSTVYYVSGGEMGAMYAITMSGGNMLSYYNTDIVFGTGITENADHTYTLTGTTTLPKADWGTNYLDYRDMYTCGDTNSTCSTVKYINYTDRYRYFYESSANKYIYGNSFTYSNGTYTLIDTKVEWSFTKNYQSDTNYHYTCLNTTGTCSSPYFFYYLNTPTTVYYIRLTGGKSITDVINEMLYDDNVNSTNSDIKTFVDTWYENNMTDYTYLLEDNVYCNDRSLANYEDSGWNPNGGSYSVDLYFRNYGDDVDLSCPNITDQFSTSNNKAKLTYPVGLMSFPEQKWATSRLKFTDGRIWTMSPYRYYHSNNGTRYIGTFSSNYMYFLLGQEYYVRPVISVSYDVMYESGTGTYTNPFIIN